MSSLVEDQPDFGQVVEDNILALLDTVGVKNADDIEDDKMSFIEAVYALCIASRQAKAPTCGVHKAVFHLLEGNHSMVLNVASYSLLVEIARQYPHILVKENTSNDMKSDVILNNKIWSPFRVDSVVEEKGRGGVATRQANQRKQYCEDFVSLLEEIQRILEGTPWGTLTEIESEEITKSSYHKVIGLVLQFKYLFKILEHDFKCRFEVYKDAEKTEIMGDCYLVHIFEEGSRMKPLLELLFNLIAHTSSISSNCEDEFLDLQELSLSLQALVEMRLALELEAIRISSTSPRKKRTDASRNPSVMELFTAVFHFNKETLKTLLQVMEDSDCKLRIIFANFLKDAPKPVVREKIRDYNNMKPQDVLNCLEDINSARNVNKAIDSTVLQVYLASAFKVGLRHTKLGGINMATLELCKSLKTAFQNLQSVNNDFHDLHPAAKQALITAETLIALAN